MSKWQGSVEEHLHLLKEAAAVVQSLSTAPQIKAVSAPKLLHPDYAKRNIFISDTGIITGIIDWQFTAIEPTFSYADNNLDFLFPHDSVDAIATKELGLGADKSSLHERASKVKNRFDILQKLFSVGLQASMRDLYQARALDQMMLRPFKYCGTSWRDGAVALREELVSISRKWTALELDGPCPYQPTAEELAQHKDRFEDLDAAIELKMIAVQAVGSDLDGWVERERFDAALQMCHELYGKLVEGETGDSRELAENMWPFDVR